MPEFTDENDLQSIRVGVVTSRFNHEVTEKLEEGALQFLESCTGVEVYAVRVPGAIEIPLAVQTLLEAGCDGVVALGAVIRGETTHYDYVCRSVERGVSNLMLSYNRPVGFGVLTTENEEQALDRAGGKHGNKGAEAAQTVIEMIGLQAEIEMDMIDEGLEYDDYDGEFGDEEDGYYDLSDFKSAEELIKALNIPEKAAKLQTKTKAKAKAKKKAAPKAAAGSKKAKKRKS